MTGGVAGFYAGSDRLCVKDERNDGAAVEAALWSPDGDKLLAEVTDWNGAAGRGNCKDLTRYYRQGTDTALEICYDEPGATPPRQCSEDQRAEM